MDSFGRSVRVEDLGGCGREGSGGIVVGVAWSSVVAWVVGVVGLAGCGQACDSVSGSGPGSWHRLTLVG